MSLPTNSKTAGTQPGPAVARPDASHRRGFGSLRMVGVAGRAFWPLLCLFQLGLMAGLGVLWKGREQNAPTRQSAHSEHTQETRPISAVARSLADSARADEFLKRGSYEHALLRYEACAEKQKGEVPDSLRFRIAMCLEGLGRWDSALAEYGEVAGRNSSDRLSWAAQLARARLWYRMRNAEEARLAICDLLVRSPPKSAAGTSVRAELCQLLGLTMAMEGLDSEPPGPRRESSLAFATLECQPEALFFWADPRATALAPPTESEADAARATDSTDSVRVRRNGPTVEDYEVSVTAQHEPSAELIRRIAAAADLECNWTEVSRERAERRIVELAPGTLSWPTLVTCLTEPLRITWEIRDEAVHLCTLDEVGEADRARRRAATGRSILMAAIRESRHKPAIAVALLGLGNLAAAEGHPETAVSWFERLTADCPRTPEVVLAQFNLGVVRRSMGDLEAARKAFFHAIDTAPSHPLTPVALLFVGRIHLEECDPEEAIAPLRRAVSMSAGTDTRPAAVIDLATAMLLVESWRAAGALLHEHQAIVDCPEYRRAAAFLGTYARFRTLPPRRPTHREGQGLVAALMGLKEETALSPCGTLLVGRAYSDLGLGEQMAETLNTALQRGVPKPIAFEISRELAEYAHTSGNHEEAARHYTVIFEGAKPADSRRAGMKLAEIALADGRNGDCLAICRDLLEDAGSEEIADILRLMGRAFDQSGDHRRAAQCFAGRTPER